MAQTHGRGGVLGASDRGTHQLKDSCHYSPPLGAVNWRGTVARTQMGKAPHIGPHMRLKLKGWWWTDRSPEPWTHPVSLMNESHVKSVDWQYSCKTVLHGAMKEMPHDILQQPLDMTPGAPWGIWLKPRSGVRAPQENRWRVSREEKWGLGTVWVPIQAQVPYSISMASLASHHPWRGT